jgi:hypothetical protein
LLLLLLLLPPLLLRRLPHSSLALPLQLQQQLLLHVSSLRPPPRPLHHPLLSPPPLPLQRPPLSLPHLLLPHLLLPPRLLLSSHPWAATARSTGQTTNLIPL